MFDLTLSGKVATLTIARPEKRNAIAAANWAELVARCEEIARSGSRVVLLRSGVAGTFSAGADLSEFTPPGEGEPTGEMIGAPMRAGIEALAGLPMPSVALIEGGCFGAAVALALACDIRVAAPESKFAVPPAKFGIAYPAEDLARIAAAVGRGQAARLIFSGAAIDGAEALRIGLADITGGAEDAENLCTAIAANSATSLVTLKALLDRAIATDFGGETDALFAQSFESDDFAKGLAAYRAREKPVFN